MSDIVVERNTVLVSEDNLIFIRPITISWALSACKPNTRMYPYFDQQSIDVYVQPDGGAQGDPIITDSSGNASGVFLVPGKAFHTGQREMVFSESSDHYSLLNEAGATFGFASAEFSSNGIKNVFQTTETTVVTEIREVVRVRENNRWRDPVAQSFNTFGVEGGCFVHSIDLYFRTKSDTVPLEVYLVEMRYGTPSNDPKDVIDRITIPAANISTSLDASVPTRIGFRNLVYLQQDREYAFVVMANTNAYYMFSSYLGEKSRETGKTIFEQPYLGSIFKSQNNSTWTAVQEEDLKFFINICDFDTTVSSSVSLAAIPPSKYAESTKFSTTLGSNVVTAALTHKHGLEVGNKIEIAAPAGGVYNGITAANLTGTFAVSAVTDEFTLQFVAGANATSTGAIATGGTVRHVTVTAGGSNYSSTNLPIVSFSGGGGTNAAGTAVVENGRITSILITNPGSGYTSVPDVVITSAEGTGATATASISATFTYSTNTVFNEIVSSLPIFAPHQTSVTGDTTFRQASYGDSGIANYAAGRTTPLRLNENTVLTQNALIANKANQDVYVGGPSGSIEVVLSSTNSNVSPVLRNSEMSIWGYENIVNNQLGEVPGDVADTELNAEDGTAVARYITVPQKLLNVSTGARLIANLYSTENTNVTVYFRGSQSSSTGSHSDTPWTLMSCDVDRNRSTQAGQFFDYSFYIDKYDGGFDVFQYKIVLRSKFPWEVPQVRNYRSIILL